MTLAMTQPRSHRYQLVAIFVIALSICFCALSMMLKPATADEVERLSLISFDDRLKVIIPFDSAAPARSGKLIVDLLDAEDNLLARSVINKYNQQSWQTELKITEKIDPALLIWHRLRYRFIADDATNNPADKILLVRAIYSSPTIKLLGQNELISGSINSLRLLAFNSLNGEAIKQGDISLELRQHDQLLAISQGEIDEFGTANLPLKIGTISGDAELRAHIQTPMGNQEIVQKVSIKRRDNIYLTTDKPIYQPGHLIHIRSLALDRVTRQAVGFTPITFEIEDAKGNKVYKLRATTDQFGVAATDFQLAEEVNMGIFKLRAILRDGESTQAQQEKSFTVARYQLPKFKIKIDLDGKENNLNKEDEQQQEYYAPGETVSGRVNAKYIFGKPIKNGQVKIRLATFDVAQRELKSIIERIDENGEYKFSLQLPKSLTGTDLDHGAARVMLEAEVTDNANHSESNTKELLVSNAPILINAIPESGTIVPNINNRIYLVTTYPNGSPARTQISGDFAPINTDENGIATIERYGLLYENLQITAVDDKGKKASQFIYLRGNQPDRLLVRTDRAIYRVGESLKITAISEQQDGAIYFDIIKDQQTILTRAARLKNGRALLNIDLSPELFGSLAVRAYILDKDTNLISDRRMIFVDPADDLKINATLNKESYRPGDEAFVDINVQSKQGTPVSAVLDLQIVDEAVFTLSERRPGMEKFFFYLQQELLKPTVQIGRLSKSENIIAQDPAEPDFKRAQRNQAAQVLFAAIEELDNPYSLTYQTNNSQLNSRNFEMAQKYRINAYIKFNNLLTKLNKYYITAQSSDDLEKDIDDAVAKGDISSSDLLDSWHQKIKIVKIDSLKARSYQIILNNQELDCQLFKYVYLAHGSVVDSNRSDVKPFTGQINYNDNNDGKFNLIQLDVITKQKIKYQTNSAAGEIDITLPGTKVTVRNLKTGVVTSANSYYFNQNRFVQLVPGSYEVIVSKPGFFTVKIDRLELTSNQFATITAFLEKAPEAYRTQLVPGYLGNIDYHTVKFQPNYQPTHSVDARIHGMVTDETGAVIAGAEVSLTNENTGEQRTAMTGETGLYQITGLDRGLYIAEFKAMGFRPGKVIDIILIDKNSTYINIALPAAGETDVVNVKIDSYLQINTTDQQLTTEISNCRLMELPLLSRDPDALILLSPGVFPSNVSGSGFSVNGSRTRSNNFQIDGLDNNDPVSEFEVISDNFTAEFGASRSFNIVTKSGTNQFHNTPQNPDEPRVRSYFPETLYINPQLITDSNGHAIVHIPLADSITNWRMSMFASTRDGALGSSNKPLNVFQDFFIDLDLPLSLTQDDIVQIPVGVYNYLKTDQEIEVKLPQQDWFTLVNDQAIKTIKLKAGEVGTVNYRIRANRIGVNQLTVSARLINNNNPLNSAIKGDAVARQIEVRPNGQEQEDVHNGTLSGSLDNEIDIPANAISDASKILVKLYPAPLAPVSEGLKNIFRMPNGCFEQTSSTTYPNILALNYMKQTGKITPEVKAQAEKFISLGYQRLMTFEVPGGGFSLYGKAPASIWLTAYGLMEFTDMSQVAEVDPRVIERTQQWLINQQKSDGQWSFDNQFNKNNKEEILRNTAYVGWALAHSGYQGEAIKHAASYLKNNLTGNEDSFTLALMTNFFVTTGTNKNFTDKLINKLLVKAHSTNKGDYWSIDGTTATYARGNIAEIEATALVAQALLTDQTASDVIKRALNYLISQRDSYGTWYSTYSTVMALKALVLSATKTPAKPFNGRLTIMVDNHEAGVLDINNDNAELFHQFDLAQFTRPGKHRVQLIYQGQGQLLYQIVGRYYLPWQKRSNSIQQNSLNIKIDYDRRELAQNDIVTATVTVSNRLARRADLVMLELGVPPGFEIMRSDIERLSQQPHKEAGGNVDKTSLTSRQIQIYFDSLNSKQTVTFKYRLRAKYPIKAMTNLSQVYEYYNPQVNAIAEPVEITVKEK